jgi:hypothetical protein
MTEPLGDTLSRTAKRLDLVNGYLTHAHWLQSLATTYSSTA